MATAELGFKKQPSKEERMEKKKQRLAAIGISFLSVASTIVTSLISNCKFIHS